MSLLRKICFALLGALCIAPATLGWADAEGAINALNNPVLAMHANASATPDLLFGLFIGVMLTAAMYLFFIWLAIRERSQVFLMLMMLALAANMAVTNDGLMNALAFYNETMREIARNYAMILAFLFGLLFTGSFLEIETNAPAMRFPLIGAGLLLLGTLFVSFIDTRLMLTALPVVGALALSATILAGLSALRLGVSGALSHISAFAFLFLAGLATPLYDMGYMDSIGLARNLNYVGIAVSTVVFALVIAGQFAARQEEKEHALSVSNERFSLAARGSNEGLFDWNLKTNEVYFSDQFRRLIGASIETHRRGLREWLRRIYPDDRKIVYAAMRKIKESETSIALNFEYRLMLRNNERRWIHTKALSVRNPHSGVLTRIVGSIGDVTQRKLGEAALKASEMRFRSITEAHPVPVLIARLHDGAILYASPGAETLLGLPAGTLTSHTIDRFLSHAPERLGILDAMASGQDVDMREVVLTRGDGEALPAALSARRINYQGEAAMVLGLYDLTEQKKADQKIQQQQEALQQSEKMAALGGLLAGVAHELNNPLSVVMGQTTLLMETAPEEKTKTRAEKIFKAADRCSRIVKSFLALARRKPPERKQIDLNPIINNSLELLGYQFRNENVDLHLELDPALPPIMGDPDQMTQVFTNLALNAAQAMHEWQGPHKLTIRTEALPDGQILVSVIDTGPGVPEESKKRVFEPFFTTKGGTGGTGVGLALCLNIIEGHGGHVALQDTDGGGATFLVTLPASSESAETQPLSEPESPAAPRTETAASNGLNLLLVDDEIELAQTLADLLEPEGYGIDLAANGQIALDKLHKHHFDAIISDLRMPVMDGPQMFAALQASLPEYTKKIIYVTGDTLSPHVHAFLSQTPVPVIEKPYRLADVKKALSALLKDNESESNMG